MNKSTPIRYIDHERKFIYWKNPKAACSSILQIFLDNKIIEGPKTNLHKKQKIESAGWMHACRHYDYFQFSFVRNPWDRFVSLYLDKTQSVIGTKWEMKAWAKYKDHSFEDFVKAIHKTGPNEIDRHSRAQFLNINRLNGINYIGKVENFSRNITTVSNKIGIDKLEIHKINSTKNRKPYQFYYNEETKEIVAEMYKKDIELFKYKYVEL